jgi:hypothetical protein
VSLSSSQIKFSEDLKAIEDQKIKKLEMIEQAKKEKEDEEIRQ